MAVQAEAVAVGTTATALHPADADVQSIEVANNSSVVVFWGDETVTVASGVPIPSGHSRYFKLSGGEVIHCVVSSGTADCRVGRIGA